eukprot:4345690-Prorocentrum_lima.AAC.1
MCIRDRTKRSFTEIDYLVHLAVVDVGRSGKIGEHGDTALQAGSSCQACICICRTEDHNARALPTGTLVSSWTTPTFSCRTLIRDIIPSASLFDPTRRQCASSNEVW